MSNENDFVASLNRLEDLIDANQAKLKRDVESIITESDRRYGSLKEELNRLKSSHSSLGQITDLLALLAEEDSRHNLRDLPNRIRGILSTITSNNHVHRQPPDLDASVTGDNVESVNIINGNELGTEGHVNGLETSIPSTGTTNDGTHLSQSISANERSGTNQFRSVADNNPIDQQADNGVYEPNKSTIDGCNESQTSKQSKSRKRKRTGKSLATESENLLENSLASIEGSTPIQRSKRIRVTSPLEIETIEQLCAGSGFDLSNGNNQNGIDSSGGEEITEQTGNKERLRNSDNKLDNKEGGNCNHLSQSKNANEQENSDSLGPALPSVSTAIEHDQTTDETGFNCSNYIEVYAEDMTGHQIDLPEGGEVLSDIQNEHLPEESNETNQNISSLVPASPSDIPVIIKVEGPSSPQSVRVCKRWVAEIDGEDLWHCDCGSDECRVKQEIKDEFDETGEIEIENNDQSVQLGTQVKEEVESGEENVIGSEDCDELNDNQNESLYEQSNGTNQCSVNDNNAIGHVDQQVDNGGDEPNNSTFGELNESLTSKQSIIRKQKCTDNSLATKSENLVENSLPSIEVASTQIKIPRSKRIRMTSPLETETIEDLSTGSDLIEVDLSNGDNQNGMDSSGGEEITEQTGNKERLRDSGTNLDDKEGGNFDHLSQSKSANEQANISVSTAIEHDQTMDESGFNCSNYIEVYAEDMDKHQIDTFEGGEVLLDNQNEHLTEESNETNQDIGALVPASPSDIPVIIKVEGSSSPQSVRVCKRWIAEIDGEDLWYCDCGSDECRVKQEIKDEFDETGEIEIENNDQSVQLGSQVKEEVENGEENIFGPEDGDALNVNTNESLPEQSNGTNQFRFVNDNNPIEQQVDNQGHESSELTIDECNESQTLKQSKTRKRKCTGKSLATESENLLENSWPNSEMDTPGPSTRSRSKRPRVTSPFERKSTEQLSTGSEVDFSEGDNAKCNDPSGEGDDQSVDEERLSDDDTEMDDEEGGYYKIEVVNLKCHECSVVVANKPELCDHFQDKHDTSLPYRCLVNECSERFDKWTGKALDKHVQDKHSDISSWTCPHCPTTFQTLKSVYVHLHKFHFEGAFRCGYDGCPNREIATLRSVVRNHQYKVHPNPLTNKIYKCEYADCGKTFEHSGNFKVHQRVHTGVKPFRCDLNGCGMLFSQQNNFKRHQRRHQGVKPYKCKECGYTAADSFDVIKHIRMKHFLLPASMKVQRQRGIKDDRDPKDYLLKTTTHQ